MLEFKDIKKSFSGVEVLHGVSFTADFRKVTAVVGENGAGKSTLMRILSGVLSDYEGEIILDGRKLLFGNTREALQNGISMIHQELNLVPDLTVGENMFLGQEPLNALGLINYNKLYKQTDEILNSYKFPYSSDTKVRNLSVGWQQIVEIAKAMQHNARILIMDEPTSALTQNEINILFDKIKYLKSLGTAIIYISHRLEELDEIADELIVLREGKFISRHKMNEISREKLISEMIGKSVFETSRSPKSIVNSPQKYILEIQNLTVTPLSIWKGVKGEVTLDNINFNISRGEILGFSGLMGSGKTELLQFLFGYLKCNYSGNIIYNGQPYTPKSTVNSVKQRIFYLSKNRKEESIFAEHNIIFNSSISSLDKTSSSGWLMEQEEKNIVLAQLEAINVRMSSHLQAIKTLSGGNQQKVVLSRGLLTNPLLLLLDEPTRGIDIGAKEEIYSILNELTKKGMSVIFTSSEIPELLRITDRILVLSHGRQTALLNTSETNGDEVLKFAFAN